MKGFRRLAIWTAIFLSCLIVFTFADEVTEVIQAHGSNARIVYNGKEVSLGIKPVLVEGYNYLSVRALAVLFDKHIDWNQSEQKILITDKPDTVSESLKSELAEKNKCIAELEEKVKKLEKASMTGKTLSIEELQDSINSEYGEYEGVPYWVILSGNEDEIRVKIEVDLGTDISSWNDLKSSEINEMIEDICSFVYTEYESAKIKGYILDISESKELYRFHNTSEGEISIGNYKNHSTISTMEDGFNEDYGRYFTGVHFTFALNGNENIVECNIYTHLDGHEKEWRKVSDEDLESFIEKLCGEIDDTFRNCYISGYIYDIDGSGELAYYEMLPDGDFILNLE